MNLPQQLLLLGVRGYRWLLSPLKTALFGPAGRCRYTPSCSAYALEALEQHGACRGSLLAVRRLCRCHPWGGFGPDPVPPPTRTSRRPGPRPRHIARSTRDLTPSPNGS